MTTPTTIRATGSDTPQPSTVPGDPCLLIIFGASGDLTKRLLMPALFNLWCDGLLSESFAIVGIAMAEMSTEQFRARMSADIKLYGTRPNFDAPAWERFVARLNYTQGNFSDPAAYKRLAEIVKQLDTQYQASGNYIFYLATPPSVFGLVSDHLSEEGFIEREKGWTRIIVEKPFGHDLPSAIALNKEMLKHWSESQIYRIDHYLGKETVQNLLAFRFSNGIFEPLWNKDHIDHIQFTVSETVGVEGRGGYYDTAGVMRDMIQNHTFQMLAYICMEPPSSFKPDSIRNEKFKILDSIHIMSPDEVVKNTVRGQYGAGKKADGTPNVAYRAEPGVNPKSATETFAALKLFIDNWRWEGVPIYIRSGKSLWKRGTEIVVQFKKAPEVIFRETPTSSRLESNKLLFHVQPDQGIELRFHAKAPGPAMFLQKVDMRFDYRESFEASRGTGYEVLLYNCMTGDATLFSRTDLVEAAWRVAQPVLDTWASIPPDEFPNYPAGSWGPMTSFDLIERDGRKWIEIFNRESMAKVPLFKEADPVFLHSLAMMLRPIVYLPGQDIVRKGDVGQEMFFICRGEAEILDDAGKSFRTLGEGDFFGEISLLLSQPRTATVRANTMCDLFILDKNDFNRVIKDFPVFASKLKAIVQSKGFTSDSKTNH